MQQREEKGPSKVLVRYHYSTRNTSLRECHLISILDSLHIPQSQTLESLLSSSFASPPTHLFISTSSSNSQATSSTSNPIPSPNLNSPKLNTFQTASLALKSGLGVLIDKSAIFNPDSVDAASQLTHSEARELVSLAKGSQATENGGKVTNGKGSGNSKFLGLSYTDLEKEE